MAPSASKQKRLAEKAAKTAAKAAKNADGTTSTSTPTGSVNGGSSMNTPLTSQSAATSVDDLSMAKLQIMTDRWELLPSRLSLAVNYVRSNKKGAFCWYFPLTLGVRRVCWFRMRKVVTSRSIRTLYRSTDDYLLKVLRYHWTTVSDMVCWERTVPERFDCLHLLIYSFSTLIISSPNLVHFPTIDCGTWYHHSWAHWYLPCPRRSWALRCQCCRFYHHFCEGKSR